MSETREDYPFLSMHRHFNSTLDVHSKGGRQRIVIDVGLKNGEVRDLAVGKSSRLHVLAPSLQLCTLHQLCSAALLMHGLARCVQTTGVLDNDAHARRDKWAGRGLVLSRHYAACGG